MSTEIRVSDSQVKTLLDHLQNLDLSPISAQAAEMAANWGKRAFLEESLRPAPWAPWSPKYEKRLKGKFAAKVSRMRSKAKRESQVFDRKLLIDKDLLRRSIRAFEVGERNSDGGYVANIASDREYAAYHQFGTSKMPARPFLPIDADLSAGTSVLTDAAWNAIKPTLERTLRRIALQV